MSKPLTSPIAEAFAAPPASKPRTPCHVGVVLTELDPTAHAAVTAAILDKKTWHASEIARRLTALGHPLKGDNVSRHRRGVLSEGDGCECPKLT